MTVNGNNFGPTSHQLLVVLTDTNLMFVGLARVYVRTGGMNSNTLNFDVTP